MMDSQQHGEAAQARPENRHIQLIALSGAIDRLVPGSASVIQSAGPELSPAMRLRFIAF